MTFYSLFLNDIKLFFPEIFVMLTSLLLLLYGVFIITSKAYNYPIITENIYYYTLLVVFLTFWLVSNNPMESSVAFSKTLISNDMTNYAKLFVLLSIFGSLLVSNSYLKNYKINNFEYYLLILFSVLSLNLLISSNDFITLYLAIEMQALVFYILAAFKKDSVYSTEAGLKYFILGAFSSGMLLFSFSIVYGIMGTTNLTEIHNICLDSSFVGYDLTKVGLIFLLSTFLFKVGSVPFHMWVPDVYEGAPTSTTVYFSIVPKLALVIVVLRMVNYSFISFNSISTSLLLLSALLSILMSSVVAYKQESLKRLLAYSGIGHVGFILLAIATNSPKAALFYSIIYIFPSFVIWGTLISCLQSSKKQSQATISMLGALSSVNPTLAIILSLSFFSLAGIPPLVGFSGKAFVLFSLLFSKHYFVSLLVVIASTISAVYYISIIKTIYFEKNKNWILYKPIDKGKALCLSLSTFLIFFLFLEPTLLLLINDIMVLEFLN
jgi:NADH-quinone oxidoreductase subunit N